MTFNLDLYFKQKKEIIDRVMLLKYMRPKETDPVILHEAMHYSLFAPGKRIRPILCLSSALALGMPESDVLPIAAALEMIHVFSLIHDDLPAMDDDGLRRGLPTNHKVYGEAIAILAGDNLVVHAFDVLTELDANKYPPQNILKVIKRLAQATGSDGMIAGQVIDMQSGGKQIDINRLKTLHRNKTGALITAAVELPAILCGAAKDTHERLVCYGNAIGLAFQIVDDILDIEGGKELGKNIGSDVKKGKATYPALMGVDRAKEAASEALTEALDALANFKDNAEPLRHIARFVVERKV
ncbi:MAG: polyprenyl synthetase family protein [Deltaproteobacteria bacterium]|nr:polyprenyl synthetase family protein [Deltaproteobacteria bacterium]